MKFYGKFLLSRLSSHSISTCLGQLLSNDNLTHAWLLLYLPFFFHSFWLFNEMNNLQTRAAPCCSGWTEDDDVNKNFFIADVLTNWAEAVFLVVCDSPMNELWATYTGQWIYLYGSRSLTGRSQKGRTRLKIQPQKCLSLDDCFQFGI